MIPFWDCPTLSDVDEPVCASTLVRVASFHDESHRPPVVSVNVVTSWMFVAKDRRLPAGVTVGGFVACLPWPVTITTDEITMATTTAPILKADTSGRGTRGDEMRRGW
jgi:hypothetical protein